MIARKEYRCIWCEEPISPGEDYARVSAFFKGVIAPGVNAVVETYHVHSDCLDEIEEMLDCRQALKNLTGATHVAIRE